MLNRSTKSNTMVEKYSNRNTPEIIKTSIQSFARLFIDLDDLIINIERYCTSSLPLRPPFWKRVHIEWTCTAALGNQWLTALLDDAAEELKGSKGSKLLERSTSSRH